MKDNLLKIIYNLNYKFFMKDCILLESNPDFCDNAKGVYDELIRRKLNNKYKIIWFVDEQSKFKDIKEYNVKFYTRKKNIFHKFRFIFYNVFSKYIIDCNKCIFKRNKNQIRIHLTHGTPIKLAKEYCKLVGEFDYLIQISDFFTETHENLFLCNKNKILSLGFPRNDELFNKNSNIRIYPEIKRNKTVFWFPTYRNHKLKKLNENDTNYFTYGIPVIKEKKQLLELNEFLKNNNILLIINLHPAEDSSKLEAIELSNIKLLSESFFDKGHTNFYQLLAKSDGFITDYSSMYYDYLLVDKPIGLAIPDIEEYKIHTDLLFDNYEENINGELIYNFTDLKKFFNNISMNKDVLKDDRRKARSKYHNYIDGNSSARVVDLFLKLIDRK